MNITVQVDEVTLDTVVHQYDGDVTTVGDMVAEAILQRLMQDRSAMLPVSQRVDQIRDEEIREAVRPLITEALTRPLRKTNTYGEATGPETTLSALIAEEARSMLRQPADNYSRSNRTIVGQIVAEEVQKAFKAEVADAVKQARELVAGQVGELVGAAVADGMRKR